MYKELNTKEVVEFVLEYLPYMEERYL